MRHLYLVLDLSRSMTEVDLKPTRLECSLNVLRTFIGEYFDQNPLSQMGVIISRNGLAEKISDLCGRLPVSIWKHSTFPAQPRILIERLEEAFKSEPLGEPSLQNSLELARAAFRY
jgi:transcription initiation factor TFIIH subunit 2